MLKTHRFFSHFSTKNEEANLRGGFKQLVVGLQFQQTVEKIQQTLNVKRKDCGKPVDGKMKTITSKKSYGIINRINTQRKKTKKLKKE